jgi:hypothetical protein
MNYNEKEKLEFIEDSIEVDQRVFSLLWGWGTVQFFFPESFECRIAVKFDNGYKASFNQNGVEERDIEIHAVGPQTLFLEEKRIGTVLLASPLKMLNPKEDNIHPIKNFWYKIKLFFANYFPTFYDWIHDSYFWFAYRFLSKHRHNRIIIGKPGYYFFNEQMEKAILLLYCRWWEIDKTQHEFSYKDTKKFTYLYDMAQTYLRYPYAPPSSSESEEEIIKQDDCFYKNKQDVLLSIVENIQAYWI